MAKIIKGLLKKLSGNYIFIGIVSLCWLIFRSGTKPSRMSYPCQKTAAANVGIMVALLPTFYLPKFLSRFKCKYYRRKIFKKAALIAGIIGLFLAGEHIYLSHKLQYDLKEISRKNSLGPVGLRLPAEIAAASNTAYAVIPAALNLPSPHRVASVHSSNATSWAGSGNPRLHMNQQEINNMVATGVMRLTGEPTVLSAWQKLIPYQNGEAVAIKLNFNNTSTWTSDPQMNPYAALVNAMIDGLISIGVPPDKIWLTDPSRPINNTFRNGIVNKQVHYYTYKITGAPGGERIFFTGYVDDSSPYSTVTDCPEKINPANVFVDAAHIINVPQLKGHGGASITLGLKNHFGSVSLTADAMGNHSTHRYFYINGSGYGGTERNMLADINDNPVFYNKTRLVIGDGLMGHPTINYQNPVLWNTFSNKPPEILFFGVDPVAVDSVMFDYLQAEAISRNAPRNDDLLHYAASIGLGVHENWNNPVQKRYTAIDYINIDFDAVPATYLINISVMGNGSVNKNPNKDEYISGESVTLTAQPASGYAFASWSGAVSGNQNPVVITVNSNISITANFSALSSNTTSQISQNGITWTFDKEYEAGQFINGDWWVKGPVTVINVNPPSTDIGGRVKNGGMINPDPSKDGSLQGYDSIMHFYGSISADTYRPALNAARPNNNSLSVSNPLLIPVNSSLISTISFDDSNRPQTKSAAILTVLETVPAENSFRPPYAGSDKTVKYNVSQINYNALKSLSKVSNSPSPGSLLEGISRPWIDHLTSYMARYQHPADNMPDYSRDMSILSSRIALTLNLDYSVNEKYPLLLRYLQLGIDNYGVMQAGKYYQYGMWVPLEGQNMGRKLPIVFAGKLLNDPDMLNIGNWWTSADCVLGTDGEWYMCIMSVEASASNRPVTGSSYANYWMRFKDVPGQLNTEPSARQRKNWVNGARYSTGHVFQEDLNVGYVESSDINRYVIGVNKGSASAVQGSDSQWYRCIKTHTADNNNRPVTGINWREYWELTSSVPSNYQQLWVAGNVFSSNTSYPVRALQYKESDAGMPEWMTRWYGPYRGFIRGDADWYEANYRGLVVCGMAGTPMVIHIMGLKDVWDRNAFLDYMDRWYYRDIVGESFQSNSVEPFVLNMWSAYRADYAPIWQSDDTGEEDGRLDDSQDVEEVRDSEKPVFKVINNILKGPRSQADVIVVVAKSENLSLKIFDSKGQEIITLWDGHKEAGEHPFTWDGTDSSGKKVGSGVYMVYMKAGSYKETKKIVIIR